MPAAGIGKGSLNPVFKPSRRNDKMLSKIRHADYRRMIERFSENFSAAKPRCSTKS